MSTKDPGASAPAGKQEKSTVLGKTARTAKAGVAAGAAAGSQVGAVAGAQVGRIGDFLKEQRQASALSLRQLSDLAGVSNPYLSQIERGLRKPSAEVLNQLAKALRISAEQLYVQAGLISPESVSTPTSVEAAVLADTRLNASQRKTLLEIHASFVALNGNGETEATTGA
ncbi:helix-turn-helix transcriptional regulator [Nocardioides sp. Y6]|uniref:Helix-turn-helix transcriptional regulator n=1 Tax=Nocardioides malaquae TaxID=2773426 RepID=A0ABR9RT93_9ACTN|nr:helix-turn-helix transcriptional regulator [Nocardioides malaquae]MBE7324805.1 helix-turn-helix transcriptional regulator [Nocardioides malaquae]